MATGMKKAQCEFSEVTAEHEAGWYMESMVTDNQVKQVAPKISKYIKLILQEMAKKPNEDNLFSIFCFLC